MIVRRVIVNRASLVLGLSSALATSGAAQKVVLELRPHVGDTIAMRLDQQTEVVGKREGAKSTPASMINTSVTYSRAVIESAVAAFSTLVAITDSVQISSTDQHGKATAAATQRQMQGQRVRLTIAPDGSVGMPNDGSEPVKGMSRAASLIPATFPANAVAIGDKWSREAPLPSGTSQLGTGMVGHVTATFRLDSLTHNGDFAYISMRGELTPDPRSKSAEGVAMVEDGTVEGWMVIDRTRGWLTESQFTIVAHSTLRPSFGSAAQTMSFEMRLNQRLRTIDHR